jgi:hypothetical protein
MLDMMLPMAIVRVEKSFLLDDDHDDFVHDSKLKHYLKDDQIKIQSKKKKERSLIQFCSFIRMYTC